MGKKLFVSITFLFAVFSCTKFVEVPVPDDQIIDAQVFSDDKTATSAIIGIYSSMMSLTALNGQVTKFGGLCADELIISFSSSSYLQFQTNQLEVDNEDVNTTWNNIYNFIYQSNACLKGIESSAGMTNEVKRQLRGEALFIRAFCNFYLVNLFGDVPIITETDYRVNKSLPRSPAAKVYDHIVADLTEAEELLPVNYPTIEKVRVNKYTASSLLARVYLYLGNWSKAEEKASEVIKSNSYQLADTGKIFLKNSPEAIWQLLPVTPNYNTQEGAQFIPSSSTVKPMYLINDTLLNSFEPGDLRKLAWIRTITVNGDKCYYPFKYRVQSGTTLTEYYTVFRLSEQYLIRSEALANQNRVAEGADDLNKIRSRAGLSNLSNLSKEKLLTAIQSERKIEFFAEWGHRWFDLKRIGHSDLLSGSKPGSNWQSTDLLWPIPSVQRNTNPNLTQNPGY